MDLNPNHRKAPNPWWVAVVCGMASYIDSCSIVSNGIALVIYQHSIGLTSSNVGVLSASLTFAIAFGAMFGGRLGDRFGRRPVFQTTMVLSILGTLCMIFASNFALMIIGTILLGLGTGADLPVSLATISEAGDDTNRGALIGLSNILWTIGILGAIGMSIVVGDMGHLGGQLMYGQILVIAVLVFIGRATIPESPVWLTAEKERTSGVATKRAQRASLSLLLKPPYLVPFLALFGFYTLVNLGANTGGQFTTYIWVNIIHKSVPFASTMGLVTFPVGILLGFLFMRTVDTRLRMPLFYAGLVCQVLSYVVPAAMGFHTWTMIGNGLLGAFGGAFAFEGLMKVWTMEKFPTLLRSTAQGNIVSIARFAAGAFAIVTPGLIDAGITKLYWGIAIVVAIGYAIAVWGFHANTRNEFDEEAKPEDTYFETAHA